MATSEHDNYYRCNATYGSRNRSETAYIQVVGEPNWYLFDGRSLLLWQKWEGECLCDVCVMGWVFVCIEYLIVEKFHEVQISQMAFLQRFSHIILLEGRFKTSPPTLHLYQRVGRWFVCKSHSMQAVVHSYYVCKKIWFTAAVGEELPYVEKWTTIVIRLIDWAIAMAVPPPHCVYIGCANLHVGLYFGTLILAVCKSTTKAMKIGDRENFLLYGTCFAAAT